VTIRVLSVVRVAGVVVAVDTTVTAIGEFLALNGARLGPGWAIRQGKSVPAPVALDDQRL